ncbi:DoxX family protein [soil metagenome]
METLLLMIGRLIFGGVFVMSGINHFTNLEMMTGYAGSKNVPFPKIAVQVSGAMLLAGGLSVILGLFPILGLWILILFLAPTSILMHNFWAISDAQQRMAEQVNFLKNLALIGASLALMFGAIAWPLSIT